MLFPERNAWCAFWRNRAGGTNGGGICTHTMPRGPERCLRESDGPFDVMYVARRRNGTIGETLFADYKRTHTRAKHARTRT